MTSIKVIAAERTFWEKATILHMLHHLPSSKPFPLRMARHYYDLFMLLNSPVKESALNDLDLLARVATHKSIFFRAASAKYDEARKGTLRLLPPEGRRQELKNDFEAMSAMFFGQIPNFDSIMSSVGDFETKFNGE